MAPWHMIAAVAAVSALAVTALTPGAVKAAAAITHPTIGPYELHICLAAPMSLMSVQGRITTS